MKKQGIERRWWLALSGWMEKHQGRGDALFVYDKKQGRLNRCFDRNVELSTVDAETVSKLYQAAAEGRLGLLRPNGMKPKQLTTDPEKLFAPDKEPSKEEEKAPATVEQDRAETKQQEKAETGAVSEPVPGLASKLDAQKMERVAAEPVIANRLREAESRYRQVVYAPKKAVNPAPQETSNGENSMVKVRAKQAAAMEQAAEIIRNALSLQENFGDEEKRLVVDLAQMMLDVGGTVEEDEDRLDRERQAKEELIAAQNLFIWAAVSYKRDRELFEARMEHLDQMVDQQMLQELEWREQLTHMARTLQKMDLKGASESECGEKIRDFLDGKKPQEQEQEAEQEKDLAVSGELLGSTLRHLCRFAASEVPLSIRHVQTGELCRQILQEAKENGIAMKELGLDPQELAVLRGTMEMSVLVEQGLLAQAALTSGQRLSGKQYRTCLQNYLAMKGMEETLIPHVQTYQKEISAGDGPISALQILMANRGFHANDLREKAGRTSVMARLKRMDPLKVAQMIREGDSELADMGRQVMIASCQMGEAPEPVHEPKMPQKGGPVR